MIRTLIALAVITMITVTGAEPVKPTLNTTGVFTFGHVASQELARLQKDGTYTFVAPVTIVLMTTKTLVVELTVTPWSFATCAVDHGGQPCPDRPRPTRHRLHFKVVDGEIVFDRVETPKHIPAAPERFEWETKP